MPNPKPLAQLSPAYRHNYCFTGPDGQAIRRDRHGRIEDHPVYDLDRMTPRERRDFRRRFMGPNPGPRMFPARPIGCRSAALLLLRMATMRRGRSKQFEGLYKKLPAFAQWRRVFDPLACIAPGKTFNKRPKRSDPGRLLETTQENK